MNRGRWISARFVAALFWLGGIVGLWAVWLMSQRNITAMSLNLVASYFFAWGLACFASQSPTSEVARRFVAMTVSLGLCAVVLEGVAALRLLDYRDLFSTRDSVPWVSRDNVLDPELLHLHRPHLHWTGPARGDIAESWHLRTGATYSCDVRYDRNGFRNQEDLSAADIAVTGDSIVEGGLVGADYLATSVIAKTMSRKVINLGQNWYGPEQELAVLRRYALPLRPQSCVWVFFEGNDLMDVARYQAALRDWPGFSRSLHTFDQRSFTRNLLLRLHRSLAPPKPVTYAQEQTGTLIVDGKPATLYFKYEGHQLTADELRALETVRRTLAAAHDLCQSASAKLVVVFAPTKFRVYDGVCEFPESSRCRHWEQSDLPARLASIVGAISKDIGFLDLTSALRAEAAQGRLVYFPDDTHWNAEGQRVVGNAISEFLKAGNSLHAPAR